MEMTVDMELTIDEPQEEKVDFAVLYGGKAAGL